MPATARSRWGHTVMKGNARKVRRLGRDGQVLAGFAGAAADAFTLFELFEAKLEKHGQLQRAAVELARIGAPSAASESLKPCWPWLTRKPR